MSPPAAARKNSSTASAVSSVCSSCTTPGMLRVWGTAFAKSAPHRLGRDRRGDWAVGDQAGDRMVEAGAHAAHARPRGRRSWHQSGVGRAWPHSRTKLAHIWRQRPPHAAATARGGLVPSDRMRGCMGTHARTRIGAGAQGRTTLAAG
jgi:hypothetical protein